MDLWVASRSLPNTEECYEKSIISTIRKPQNRAPQTSIPVDRADAQADVHPHACGEGQKASDKVYSTDRTLSSSLGSVLRSIRVSGARTPVEHMQASQVCMHTLSPSLSNPEDTRKNTMALTIL